MELSKEDLIYITSEAEIAAKKAGKYIMENFNKDTIVEIKGSANSRASEVVTETDRGAEEIVQKHLQPISDKFDLAMLAEESEDNGSRFEKDYFWAIDPIDGTYSFIEKEEGFAVSIALISKSGISVIGVVLNPFNGDIYSATIGCGAYKNDQPMKSANEEKENCKNYLFKDKSFLFSENKDKIAEMAKVIFLNNSYEYNFVIKGGAVMASMWALEKQHATIFKLPKQSDGGGCIWDYAAIACIYQEHSRCVCDINFKPLNFNRESVYFNDCGVVFATSAELGKRISDTYNEAL